MSLRPAPIKPQGGGQRPFVSLLSQVDSRTLWTELRDRIAPLIHFDFLSVALYDPRSGAFRSRILEPPRPITDGAQMDELMRFLCIPGVDKAVIGSCREENRFFNFPHLLTQYNIQSYCSAPLVSDGKEVLGTITVGSTRPNAYHDADAQLLSAIAFQLALVFECSLDLDSAAERQLALERERDLLLAIRDVYSSIDTTRNLQQLIAAVSSSIQRVSGAHCAELVLYDPTSANFRRAASYYIAEDGTGHSIGEYVHREDDSPAVIAFRSKQLVVGGSELLKRYAGRFEQISYLMSFGIHAFCCIPLMSRGRVLGTLNVGSFADEQFTQSSIGALSEIARPVAISVESALAREEITTLKARMAREESYVSGKIKPDCLFRGIIGESEALHSVLGQVRDVADSDATVLILGETGTGKELIARALHELSPRKDRPFVKLNCAAVPAGLLESELFGYEKGAFTGAFRTKEGLLELANHGTLLLDEVGDIPLEIQPKLLRVLQEGEFARVGSTRTLKTDVRLVAATNRDLLQMVKEHQYRSDLYYRVNVIPITLPPLRERKEDIPLLVKHFTQKFSARRKEAIRSIPSEVMEALVNWSWPGNVRELENFIERSVILSKGSVLNVSLKELQDNTNRFSASMEPVVTPLSDEITAEVILRTLRDTNGIVSGPRGAATRLGMKRTTLLWRMNSLGITRSRALSPVDQNS